MPELTIDEALKTKRRPLIFAAILNLIGQGGQFCLTENRKYLEGTLCQNQDFVTAARNAHEREVRIRIITGPSISPTTENQYLFSHLKRAYAFGGANHVARYFMASGTTVDGKPITREQAYETAKSFEREVLGRKRYLIRLGGIVGRILGRVERIKIR